MRRDYPIVSFVGFRVRKVEDGAIYVSREKDIVNVISLALDPAKIAQVIDRGSSHAVSLRAGSGPRAPILEAGARIIFPVAEPRSA